MEHAGWIDVWNLAVAIVARQAPFAQIAYALAGVLFVVMAIEGLRTSLLAMLHAARPAALHRTPQPPSEPVTMAAAPEPASRAYVARPVPRATARPLSNNKPKRTPGAAASRLRAAGGLPVKNESVQYGGRTPGFAAIPPAPGMASV